MNIALTQEGSTNSTQWKQLWSLAALYGSIVIGWIVVIVSMAAIFMASSAWMIILLTVIFTVVFTVLSVSTLPLTIQLARHDEKVLCVGIFFSGVALPDAIIQTFLMLR